MAEVRYIKTRIWRDAWFAQLSKNAQHLFVFLVTNESTRLSGFYEMPFDDIAHHTKTKPSDLKKLLKEVESRVVFLDGWVCVKNYAEHQNAGNSPKVAKLIEYELAKVPESVQKKAGEFFIHNSYSYSYSYSVGIDRVSIPHTESEKKSAIPTDSQYGETGRVHMTTEEYQKLVEAFGERNTNVLIEELDDYIGMKGNKYKSHYKALRSWGNRKIQEYMQKRGKDGVKKEIV